MNLAQKIDHQISSLEEQKQTIKLRQMVTCPHCKKRTRISKATIIVDYFYVPPRGCTGGDYWNFNEYLYCCSKCNVNTRAYIGSWDKDWKTEELTLSALKEARVILFNFIKKNIEYFGEVLKSYDEKRLELDELRALNEERKERKNDWW